MASVMAAMLDELMGRDRNLAPDDQSRGIRWDDKRVCKYFLCGMCPHELFTNTKADIGNCDKIHDEELKKDFAKASYYERGQVEDDFERMVEQHLREVDKKIARGHNRLKLSREQSMDAAQSNMLFGGPNDDKIKMLTEKINDLVDQAETLGCEGKVEEAQGITRLCDRLKEERQQLAYQGSRIPSMIDTAMREEKMMEVCEICGAFLIVGDAQSRIDDHLMGKQHMGYAKLRNCLTEVRESRQKVKEEREKAKAEAEAERQKRRDERDKSREKDRDRSSRDGDDRRSKRRDDRRRSRSRERSRRSRSRDRGGKERSRSRDRGGRDKERSRSRDRDRGRDRDRKRSRSREDRDRKKDSDAKSRDSDKSKADGDRSKTNGDRSKVKSSRSQSRERKRRSRSRSRDRRKGDRKERSRSRDRHREDKKDVKKEERREEEKSETKEEQKEPAASSSSTSSIGKAAKTETESDEDDDSNNRPAMAMSSLLSRIRNGEGYPG